MGSPQASSDLREEIRQFWNSEPCGTRYLECADDFASHARTRYELEPHILEFADFARASGLRVLEIGVGMGADYFEWLRAGAKATGIDLSSASLELARRRCELAGYKPDLLLADAEHLPFPDQSFDVVYSYGVMHHSPDTSKCLQETWRVLRPGGQARVMLYHHPSLTGLMLWLRYGIFRGKSLRQAVYHHLESPGTKSFTKNEVRCMLAEFEGVKMHQVFSPGDLLMNRPSQRFRSPVYRLTWALFPRSILKMFCRSLGLFLLVSAQKPHLGDDKSRVGIL